MSRIGDGAVATAPAGVVSTVDNAQLNGPVQATATAQVETANPVQAQVKAQFAAAPATADAFLPGQGPGIAPGGCIPPHPLPFPLPEPQPLPLPHPLPIPVPVPFPKRDASADKALAELNQKPAPISGEDMAAAIEKGTKDLDGHAASSEYRQFSQWAQQNQDKLSPEAKEVMKVYSNYAHEAQAHGQTGIPQGEYKKMVAEMKSTAKVDVSAKNAIDELNKGSGKVSGEDMTRAIEKGTSDLDGHAASSEFDQFAKWAQQNPGRLSPEAKQVMDIYKKYANQAKANGQSGISQADYQKMLGEMKQVKTYKDESAGAALDKLNHTKGPVSGQQMYEAIKNGTQDLDGQAAGNEMQDFMAWARQNASRLSPEAKKELTIYLKYATQALLNGQTGISQADYQKMLGEMRSALKPPPPVYVAA